MAIFAVTNGRGISNMIISDTKEIAEAVSKSVCIESTDEYPITLDWTFNGTTWVAPPKPVVED